jgi:hypothetical protein
MWTTNTVSAVIEFDRRSVGWRSLGRIISRMPVPLDGRASLTASEDWRWVLSRRLGHQRTSDAW